MTSHSNLCPHCGAPTYRHTPTPDDRPRRICRKRKTMGCGRVTIEGGPKTIVGRPRIHVNDADRQRKKREALSEEERDRLRAIKTQRQRDRRAEKKIDQFSTIDRSSQD